MRVKSKKVYYCEFCRKHNLSASAMSIHEKHCLKNLDRECRLCKNSDLTPLTKEVKILIIDKIKAQMSCLKDVGEGINTSDIKQPTIEEVKNWAGEQGWEGCPNCLMSIIILSGIHNFPYNIDYDYKKELENWWADKNEEERVKDEMATYY